MADGEFPSTLREAWQQLEPWGLVPWGLAALGAIAWSVVTWISHGNSLDRVGVVGIFVGLLAVAVSVSTLVFVLRQVRLAEKQNALVAEELEITKRQTKILQHQEEELNRQPNLFFFFHDRKSVLVVRSLAAPTRDGHVSEFVRQSNNASAYATLTSFS